MPRVWGYFWGIIMGILLSLTVLMVFPYFKWKASLLILATGGFCGGFGQIAVVIFFKKLLKKIPVQALLVYGFSLLFSLLVVELINSIIWPYLELLPLKNGLLTLFLSSILILSGLLLMVTLKFKELSLFFNGTGWQNPKRTLGEGDFKILDTSAIIDGRIADLCKTGFLEGILIIPNFVLNELQKIADSADSLRRNRGRRGLDLLNRIQKENQVTIRIFDRDYEELADVDTKLLRLARELEAKVITNDFNLNKVAELYGVKVLNINELSNAIKPVVLPGEEMIVRILRDGKEYGQGIGYLEDGTMIVVEGGKSFIGVDLEILVTSVLQTSAGRMIFAKPKEYLVSKITS